MGEKLGSDLNFNREFFDLVVFSVLKHGQLKIEGSEDGYVLFSITPDDDPESLETSFAIMDKSSGKCAFAFYGNPLVTHLLNKIQSRKEERQDRKTAMGLYGLGDKTGPGD